MSRGIPHLREEIVKRYKTKYDVDLDPENAKRSSPSARRTRWRICCLRSSDPGDAVVSPNPAYPIHQYGVIMAEGHACMLPMPDPAEFLNGLEHLYRTSHAQAQDDPDLVPAQPHHAVRGSGFFQGDRGAWPPTTGP